MRKKYDTEEKEEESSRISGKAARKKKNFKIALGVTLGVVFLALACLFIWRHQIINYFTTPDKEAVNEPATYIKKKPADTGSTDTEPVNEFPEMTEDVYNFLICGYDRVANLSDVNMLVSFNVKYLTVSIMQIPRDTYVNYESWYHKANGVFQYFMTGNSYNEDIQRRLDQFDVNTEQEMRGIAGFAAFLEDNLCVKIHYYAVMDLEEFANIVDALGGVEMYVPRRMYYEDPNQTPPLYIDLYEGYQTLDGKAAEGVVRFRNTYGNGDIGRGNVQKMFMAALFKTIQSKTNIFNAGKIIDVCNIISDNLVTNMSTSDMIYFANNLMTVNLQYVTFMTLPGNAFWGDDQLSYYSLNKEATLEYINKYFNIYSEQVTLDQFDANGAFFNYSYVYSAPASDSAQFIYDAEQMTNGDFDPVT